MLRAPLMPPTEGHEDAKKPTARRRLVEGVLLDSRAAAVPARAFPRRRTHEREVAEIVGVTWEQLRYAIELGRVTDCEGRDGQGHRRWTEAEVERVLEEFGVAVREGQEHVEDDRAH